MNIEKIKEQLELEKKALQNRIHKIEKHLYHPEKPMSADFSEQAVELENEEVLIHLDQVEVEKLQGIEKALYRIQEGSFGTCDECGKSIAEGRLKAIPYSELCIQCAQEKGL